MRFMWLVARVRVNGHVVRWQLRILVPGIVCFSDIVASAQELTPRASQTRIS